MGINNCTKKMSVFSPTQPYKERTHVSRGSTQPHTHTRQQMGYSFHFGHPLTRAKCLLQMLTTFLVRSNATSRESIPRIKEHPQTQCLNKSRYSTFTESSQHCNDSSEEKKVNAYARGFKNYILNVENVENRIHNLKNYI